MVERKRSNYFCKIHCQISMASSWKHDSHLFPAFRGGRADKIFSLEFSKDGPADIETNLLMVNTSQ